jgi:hypothetical protein
MQHPGNSFCRFHDNPPETLIPGTGYAGTFNVIFLSQMAGNILMQIKQV